MKYRVTQLHTDSVGHHLLQLQNKKTQSCIDACDTEIEARRSGNEMEYILKAITLDNTRVWLWTTNDLCRAYRRKSLLDKLLYPRRREDTS